jgi:hypothetical protein
MMPVYLTIGYLWNNQEERGKTRNLSGLSCSELTHFFNPYYLIKNINKLAKGKNVAFFEVLQNRNIRGGKNSRFPGRVPKTL